MKSPFLPIIGYGVRSIKELGGFHLIPAIPCKHILNELRRQWQSHCTCAWSAPSFPLTYMARMLSMLKCSTEVTSLGIEGMATGTGAGTGMTRLSLQVLTKAFHLCAPAPALTSAAEMDQREIVDTWCQCHVRNHLDPSFSYNNLRSRSSTLTLALDAFFAGCCLGRKTLWEGQYLEPGDLRLSQWRAEHEAFPRARGTGAPMRLDLRSIILIQSIHSGERKPLTLMVAR